MESYLRSEGELLPPARIIAQALLTATSEIIAEESVMLRTRGCCPELFATRSLGRATLTGTEGSKVIVRVNTRAMTIMPAQLDRVVPHPADLL
jgi:hypothetical protein